MAEQTIYRFTADDVNDLIVLSRLHLAKDMITEELDKVRRQASTQSTRRVVEEVSRAAEMIGLALDSVYVKVSSDVQRAFDDWKNASGV